MIYLILVLSVVFFLSWKKSKSNFFEQSRDVLYDKSKFLIEVLKDRGLDSKEISYIIWCYDNFRKYPNLFKFDGATIVKDLNDLPNLDLDAMLHDYQYLCGANKNFIAKWYSDLEYIKNMEKNGKGVRVFRLLLLTLSGILFVPYCKIFK